MLRKYIVPVLAVAGLTVAVYTVLRGDSPPAPAPRITEAPQSPYAAFVAGAGLVEPSTETIAIGTQVGGIVTNIAARIGGNVRAGEPLFTIDDRAARAEVSVRQAAIPVAEAELADAQYVLAHAETLAAERITTIEDRERKRFAMQKAQAQWEQANAELRAAETDLALYTVRAPVNGQVLQLKVHVGEFASVGPPAAGQPPLLLLGSITPLHVRVDVDENDAWRVPAGAPATGYLRGNRQLHTPLTFVRFEPYVLPKQSLTGDSTERVDTRVLQIIFSFERGNLPIFVGQQMDVFIDASGRPLAGRS